VWRTKVKKRGTAVSLYMAQASHGDCTVQAAYGSMQQGEKCAPAGRQSPIVYNHPADIVHMCRRRELWQLCSRYEAGVSRSAAGEVGRERVAVAERTVMSAGGRVARVRQLVQGLYGGWQAGSPGEVWPSIQQAGGGRQKRWLRQATVQQ